MQAVTIISGRALPLSRDNVDTDVILPARFLKTITRAGLGVGAFETVRAEPGNPFDDPLYAGAPIMIAGANFGCGSSREHAVWAMLDFGLQAVIAESYSDIFSGNAFKNGMLAIALTLAQLDRVRARTQAGEAMTIDLEAQTLRLSDCVEIGFEMDPFRKDCLLRGLDEIDLTLAYDDTIAAFEAQRDVQHRWLSLPAGAT